MSHETPKSKQQIYNKIKAATIIYMMQLHFVTYIPSKAYTIYQQSLNLDNNETIND